jgi:translation initiation factor IF-3
MAHQEFGMELMHKVKNDLAGMSQVEMEPKIAGRNVTMTLSPLPAARRKRRFAPVAEADMPPENGSEPANR